MGRHLLILNFTMDTKHTALSHQYEVVHRLSERFDRITVITGQAPTKALPVNVFTTVISWRRNSRFLNSVLLLYEFTRICLTKRPNYIFSHMVPIHAAITSPISKILRIRHVLWYAHAALPFSLRFASIFVDQIVSSTPGSCKLKSSKVSLIGQGIDASIFDFRTRNFSDLRVFLHVGRTDFSKRIDLVINTIDVARLTFPGLELRLVGGNLDSLPIAIPHWVKAISAVPRSALPEIYKGSDVFIHAFLGSLDKVLVEAVMSGLPVVTENLEFKRNFQIFGDFSTDLLGQLTNLLLASPDTIANIVAANYETAINEHEMSVWIARLESKLVDPDDKG
jgi:glycosyltransferase involved in cell wall biosynthesis